MSKVAFVVPIIFFLCVSISSRSVHADQLVVESNSSAVISQSDSVMFNGIVDYSEIANISITYSVQNSSGDIVMPNTSITNFQNQGLPVYFEHSIPIESSLAEQGSYTIDVFLRSGGLNGSVITSESIDFFVSHPRRPMEPVINQTTNGMTATITLGNNPDSQITANRFQFRYSNNDSWSLYSNPLQVNSNRYIYVRACLDDVCSKVKDVYVSGISPIPHTPNMISGEFVLSIDQEYESIYLVNFRRGERITIPIPNGNFP